MSTKHFLDTLCALFLNFFLFASILKIRVDFISVYPLKFLLKIVLLCGVMRIKFVFKFISFILLFLLLQSTEILTTQIKNR